MSRQYYDDPYGSSHRRVPIQSYQQPPNNSSRRNVPSVSRDFVSPSSFQPNRDRHVYPPPPPPPPPPVRNYREEYPRYDEYQNSPRLSSNRMNVSQRFLLMKQISNVLNRRIHQIINNNNSVDID